MDWDIDGFIAAIAGVFAVAAVIGIILYLIASIARYRYLRIRSYENAWMAFIPIVNIWAVVEATYGRRERINIYGWDAPATVLKLWPIVTYALALVINVIPMMYNRAGKCPARPDRHRHPPPPSPSSARARSVCCS